MALFIFIIINLTIVFVFIVLVLVVITAFNDLRHFLDCCFCCIRVIWILSQIFRNLHILSKRGSGARGYAACAVLLHLFKCVSWIPRGDPDIVHDLVFSPFCLMCFAIVDLVSVGAKDFLIIPKLRPLADTLIQSVIWCLAAYDCIHLIFQYDSRFRPSAYVVPALESRGTCRTYILCCQNFGEKWVCNITELKCVTRVGCMYAIELVLVLQLVRRHSTQRLDVLVESIVMSSSAALLVRHERHSLVLAIRRILAWVNPPGHEGFSPRTTLEKVATVDCSLSESSALVPAKLVVHHMSRNNGSFFQQVLNFGHQGLQIRRERRLWL